MATTVFQDYFWGDKNIGFNVLYHSMKYGQVSSRHVSEFFREQAALEEAYAKGMAKLLKNVTNDNVSEPKDGKKEKFKAKTEYKFKTSGTFGPLWDRLREATERNIDIRFGLQKVLLELSKDVSKYTDEQHAKHKATKTKLATTAEIVQGMQSITTSLFKAEELYFSRGFQNEKIRHAQKLNDKGEVKFKKAKDEYKTFVNKYATVKERFVKKMNTAAADFQYIEELHLAKMRSFLDSYVDLSGKSEASLCESMTQLHEDVSKCEIPELIQKFAQTHGTGSEFPDSISAIDVDFTQEARAENVSKKRWHHRGRKQNELEKSNEEFSRTSSIRSDQSVPGAQPSGTAPLAHESSSDSDWEDDHFKLDVRIRPANAKSQQVGSDDAIKLAFQGLRLTSPLTVPGLTKDKRTASTFTIDHPDDLVMPPPRPAPPQFGKGQLVSPSEEIKFNASASANFFHHNKIESLVLSGRPSPLSFDASAPIPIACAITESVSVDFVSPFNAFPEAKVIGSILLSFPSGFVQRFAVSTPPQLAFSLSDSDNLAEVVINKSLLSSEPEDEIGDGVVYSFKMPALMLHLKKLLDDSPTSPYYNVDVIKYVGDMVTPVNLEGEWVYEESKLTSTLDYNFDSAIEEWNGRIDDLKVVLECGDGASLVDGGHSAIWDEQEHRLRWDVGTVLPTDSPQPIKSTVSCADHSVKPFYSVEFTVKGMLASNLNFDLINQHYRLSMVKKTMRSATYRCIPTADTEF